MERPLLVASDIDGTLFGADHRPSPRTTAVVRRVVASGVPFVLATGRPPRWIAPALELLGVTCPAVCVNGAVLFDPAADAVLHASTIDVDLLRHAERVLSELLPDALLAVERVTAGAPPCLTDPGYRHPWPGYDSAVGTRAELFAGPAVKLLVSRAGTANETLVAGLTEALGGLFDITFTTAPGLVELCVAGVSKATAVAVLAGRHGIDASGVLAFGDMPNDVELLGWAGHGVAVGNAHPAALAVADEVTAANTEDGVATVLERWLW